jgi:hypothetical protein
VIETQALGSDINMGPITLLALASWVCSRTSYWCEPPNASIIQQAYERESAADSNLHDRGLRVLDAKCGQSKASDYLCEVTFTSSADVDERLYFDVIRIAQIDDGGWRLESGLCKR